MRVYLLPEAQGKRTMALSLCMSVRQWAVLDMAMGFFRGAPANSKSAERLAKHCRWVHKRLKQVGIKADYVSVSAPEEEHPELRLGMEGPFDFEDELVLPLPKCIICSLAYLCLVIIETHANPSLPPLLDYEAEELLVCRQFLTELRENGIKLKTVVGGWKRMRWHHRTRQYAFPPLVADRLHKYYCRIGACLN
jgi:hypothetical protein